MLKWHVSGFAAVVDKVFPSNEMPNDFHTEQYEIAVFAALDGWPGPERRKKIYAGMNE